MPAGRAYLVHFLAEAISPRSAHRCYIVLPNPTKETTSQQMKSQLLFFIKCFGRKFGVDFRPRLIQMHSVPARPTRSNFAHFHVENWCLRLIQ